MMTLLLRFAWLMLSSVAVAGDPLFQPNAVYSTGRSLDTTLVVNTARLDCGSFSFNTRTYNGGFPGPTLVVSAGDRVRVKLVNALESQPVAGEEEHNTMHSPNTTNLHTHGLHVASAGAQDNMFMAAGPGQELQYEYEIHDDHLAGTHWYHPHHHGSTALQVSGGMAGVIVVLDEPSHPLSSVPSVVLLLQPIYYNSGSPFDDHVQMSTQSGSTLPLDGKGDNGDVVLVNGQVTPEASIVPGQWQRWRLVWASPNAVIELSIRGGKCEMQLIANDGVYLFSGAPKAVTKVVFVPGSRRDVLVRCSEAGTYAVVDADGGTVFQVVAKGSTVTTSLPESLPALPAYMPDLRSSSVDNTFDVNFGLGEELSEDMYWGIPLMLLLLPLSAPLYFYLVKKRYNSISPQQPQDFNDVETEELIDSEKQAAPTSDSKKSKNLSKKNFCRVFWASSVFFTIAVLVTVVVVTLDDTFTVNGAEFTSSSDYVHTMQLGKVDEWTTGGAHPFHIHINHFQLHSLPDGCNVGDDCASGFEPGNFYDTIMMNAGGGGGGGGGGGDAVIRFKPADYVGKCVFHCHILSHEDQGMMAVAEITA